MSVLLLTWLLTWMPVFGLGADVQDKSDIPTPSDGPSAAGSTEPTKGAVPMTDIHGIKPPEPAGFDPTPLYYAAAGAAVLAVAVFSFLIWKHRRRRLRVSTTPGFSPEETALAALDELVNVEETDGKIFYFRLSAVLRRYLEARYRIHAPEMTTEELLSEIKHLGMDPALRKGLRSLLETADPIKYAGAPASVRAMEDHVAFARRFVRETTPTPAQEV
ncbi:MAG: DUF4381 family protein [Thermodesulfobacteriota bacterium]